MVFYNGLAFLAILLLGCLSQLAALPTDAQTGLQIVPYKNGTLQSIVTWDEHSIFVYGARVVFFSAEFHPFRLPVPRLWLDIFEKIKAAGFTGVSFYVDWALLEGTPGNYSAESVFDLEDFFKAAEDAGLYLLARPGPYINAEVSGGGFPGWLQRVKGTLRTNASDYLASTELYMTSILSTISKHQITNGGPVILVQPENEYSQAVSGVLFPDATYMTFVEDQFRKNGIVVPLLSNDAAPHGYNAPGQPAPVDIYGHDGYPVGFDCSNPEAWKGFSTNWHTLHERQSPNTPYAIVEFQGGAFDPWGGVGFEKCLSLVGTEFERVYYKNNYGFGVSIYNIYMVYGGTNWGNLGHPGGYTSYDYGAAIAEDRGVSREKYSEIKLQANFVVASDEDYLTAIPGDPSTTQYTTSSDIYVTPLKSNETQAQFYVVRHNTFNSTDSTAYMLKVNSPTLGNITIPQLNGSLSLHGRDSKIHVMDYNLGRIKLLYSTAEILTWQVDEKEDDDDDDDKGVLVVYGGPGEQHELAVGRHGATVPSIVSSSGLQTKITANSVIVNWETMPEDRFLQIDNLRIYIVDRNSAYNFWVIPFPFVVGETVRLYTKRDYGHLIVKGGYLIRRAWIYEETGVLAIEGDLNATTPLIIHDGAPENLTSIVFNNEKHNFTRHSNGTISTELVYVPPIFELPKLADLDWYYIDSLPEIRKGYDDSHWTPASLLTTNNTNRALTTPNSLYASDYGYHTGVLLYRGTFIAQANDLPFVRLLTQGGTAYGCSVWVDDIFLGSVIGNASSSSSNVTYGLRRLGVNETHVFTVVVDNMGLDEEWTVGSGTMKAPRGLLDYELVGRDPKDIEWKITGNLGGENYADHIRGPLNEGGLWAERQGYHLPNPPIATGNDTWRKLNPIDGIQQAGVGFFTTYFDLDLPRNYDIPLSIRLSYGNVTSNYPSPIRVQIYVNGWQYGKYVSNIGPQKDFYVPEGIWNYRGRNWVAITLWAMDAEGGKLDNIELVAGQPTFTTSTEIPDYASAYPGWVKRETAY